MDNKILELFKTGIPYFEILREENRQEILHNLLINGPMAVTEITELSKLSRPAVSHHLKLLRDSGLVDFTKNGNQRIYSARIDFFIPLLEELLEALKETVKYSKEKFGDD